MVSVMDSAGPECDEQPVLPAWHRHQCGDTLQGIAVPLPGKTLHGTVNVVPLHRLVFFMTISHIAPGFPPLAQQPPLKPHSD